MNSAASVNFCHLISFLGCSQAPSYASGFPIMPLLCPAFLALALSAVAAPQEEAGPSSESPRPVDPAGQAPDERTEGARAGATFDLDTLVVTPSRRKQAMLDVPYSVDFVSKERLEQARSLPQALRDVPGVMVQETGPAQGSPYIRGFTGFRTLTLVDGIRLNNSVFRDGPNQYAGTIDPFSLSGIEVVKGPSSVLYGSDAIGGTINALTKDPEIWDRPIGGEVFVRAADAANYVMSRVELGGAVGDRTAWRLGGTLKDLGDMTAGDPSGELPNTGYDEWDGDFKAQHLVDELTTLTFAAQHVDIDDAPRTHRTVFAVPFEGSAVGSDFRRDLDQERTLTYFRYDRAAAAEGDWELQSIVSYHQQEERRERERTGDRFDVQGFDVGTLGLQFSGSRATSFGTITAGLEWYHDEVDSFLNKFADQTAADEIQGPVGDDSTYDLGGLFAEAAFDVLDSTTVTAGARATYAAADANEVRDPVTDTQIEVEDDWAALTGSLRFETRMVDDGAATIALFGGISQGFRAPNLSDLTRFDSARSNEFEVPSPGLDPERFISYELGVKHATDQLSLQLVLDVLRVRPQLSDQGAASQQPQHDYTHAGGSSVQSPGPWFRGEPLPRPAVRARSQRAAHCRTESGKRGNQAPSRRSRAMIIHWR